MKRNAFNCCVITLILIMGGAFFFSPQVSAHEHPRGEIYPCVITNNDQFLVLYSFNHPTNSNLNKAFTRIYNSDGTFIKEREHANSDFDLTLQQVQIYDGESISQLHQTPSLIQRLPFLAGEWRCFIAHTTPDEVYLINPYSPSELWVFNSNTINRIIIPTYHTKFAQGSADRMPPGKHNTIQRCFDLTMWEDFFVVLGYSAEAKIEWRTHHSFTLFGKKLFKWTRKHADTFSNYNLEMRSLIESESSYDYYDVTKLERSMSLFFVDTESVYSTHLGFPRIYGWGGLITSRIIHYNNFMCVAWADQKNRIILTLCDVIEPENIVIKNKVSIVTGISMARIGKNILIAWSEYPESDPYRKNKLKTLKYTLPEKFSLKQDKENNQTKTNQ
ncbi:hypothetical protein ACFLS1_04620 [Verrucomicrobiota bacterium]